MEGGGGYDYSGLESIYLPFHLGKSFSMGFLNYIYIVTKKDHMNHSLDLNFDKNNKNRKSYEGIKSNLRWYLAWIQNIYPKKEHCSEMMFVNIYDLRSNIRTVIFWFFLRILSSFDRVMQFFWLFVIFVNAKTKKRFINLVSSSCIPVKWLGNKLGKLYLQRL